MKTSLRVESLSTIYRELSSSISIILAVIFISNLLYNINVSFSLRT